MRTQWRWSIPLIVGAVGLVAVGLWLPRIADGLVCTYLGSSGKTGRFRVAIVAGGGGGECRERVFGQQGLCPVYALAHLLRHVALH